MMLRSNVKGSNDRHSPYVACTQDGAAAPAVDVGRGEIVQALVMAPMIV